MTRWGLLCDSGPWSCSNRSHLFSVLMGKQQLVAWRTNDRKVIGKDEQEATHADLDWVMVCRWCDATLCLVPNVIQRFPHWLQLVGQHWSTSSKVFDDTTALQIAPTLIYNKQVGLKLYTSVCIYSCFTSSIFHHHLAHSVRRLHSNSVRLFGHKLVSTVAALFSEKRKFL